MKKLWILLILVMCLIPRTVFSLVSPSGYLYVTDEADIIDEETEDYIVRYSDFLEKKKNIKYYVVTVESLESIELDQYIQYVTNTFKMGNRSILFFFTKNEKMIQVVLGSSISNIMSEEEITDYINEFSMPYFQNGEWNKGIKNGYTAFYKRTCGYYHIDTSSMELFSGKEFTTKYRYPILMVLVFLGMFFGYNFCSFFKKVLRHKKTTYGDFVGFFIMVFANVVLLGFGYYIEPWLLLILLGVEYLAISTTFKDNNMSIEEAFKKVRLEEQKKEKAKKKRQVIRKKVKK